MIDVHEGRAEHLCKESYNKAHNIGICAVIAPSTISITRNAQNIPTCPQDQALRP